MGGKEIKRDTERGIGVEGGREGGGNGRDRRVRLGERRCCLCVCRRVDGASGERGEKVVVALVAGAPGAQGHLPGVGLLVCEVGGRRRGC